MKNTISLFNEIYNKLMKKYHESSVSSKFDHVLTTRDEFYLDILYGMHQPTSTEFAKKANISKPAATQIIHQYIDEGYLVKIPSTTDKRVKYLLLSPDICEYFSQSYKELDNLYHSSLSFLSETEKEQLEKILRKINRNL